MDFVFDFAVVEQFHGGHFEDGVAFGDDCFERRWSLVGCVSLFGILGSQIYNRRVLSRCKWLVLGQINI